jgi:hypothetical protein
MKICEYLCGIFDSFRSQVTSGEREGERKAVSFVTMVCVPFMFRNTR